MDLGKRGTWPLGSISNRKLLPGEQTYVDAIIDQASAFARAEKLPFTADHKLLRTQLLSHGKGEDGLQFIDTKTRDSINDWAQSAQGKSWIHTHIDMPQIQELTKNAVNLLNKHGSHVSEEDRFKVICMLAKTANQLPAMVGGLDHKKHGHITGLKETLAAKGDYEDLLSTVSSQKKHYRFLASDKAALVGGYYESHLADPDIAESMKRAHQKVTSSSYSPAKERQDPDIQLALDAYRHPASKHKRAELSPELQQDFDRIQTAIAADGRWTLPETDNISTALLLKTAGNDLIQRVDRVFVGKPAPMDGEVHVFAQYRPHGDQGPAFTAQVGASSASQIPAQESWSELQDMIQQKIHQQTLASQHQHQHQHQEQASRSFVG